MCKESREGFLKASTGRRWPLLADSEHLLFSLVPSLLMQPQERSERWCCALLGVGTSAHGAV